MKPAIQIKKSMAIVYDASLMDAPGAGYFSVDFWDSQGALSGAAVGRGSAWFIDTPVGPAVLRQYLRGGWVAKFSRQSYFFTSVLRSRPLREFRLLSALYELDLPVPRPIAAMCQHHGFISTGKIMTARILSAQTLADTLPGRTRNSDTVDDLWEKVGKCIRRFHDAGVWHADLNARNILLDKQSQVFLIDFDRARFRPGSAVKGEGNLHRLERSLAKQWPKEEMPAMRSAWTQLKTGYYG
jgi:3-deoxy-D-manno-octulosonic acid kinase